MRQHPALVVDPQHLESDGRAHRMPGIGVAVPDRVAVAGFDDVPLAHYLDLSTISVDIVGLGMRAVEVLLATMAGDTAPPRTELSKTRLVLRGTTRTAA